VKVFKVDGEFYLAEQGEGVLMNAMPLDTDNIMSRVCKQDFVQYLCTENMNELLQVEVGAHSAVTSRLLTEEEGIVFDTLMSQFDLAKGKAIKAVENKYFRANF
jgi:hypothetical protein